jgi:hypothetical protein
MTREDTIISVADMMPAMDEFIETTSFDVPADPAGPDPEPHAAGEGEWDDDNTVSVNKTKLQL